MNTEAGKPVCIHGHAYGLHPADEPPDCETFAPVSEHKAEAVAAERERIRAAVEGLPKWDKRTVPGGFHVRRSAVLRIVNPEADDA